jgi:hypothetical protein
MEARALARRPGGGRGPRRSARAYRPHRCWEREPCGQHVAWAGLAACPSMEALSRGGMPHWVGPRRGRRGQQGGRVRAATMVTILPLIRRSTAGGAGQWPGRRRARPGTAKVADTAAHGGDRAREQWAIRATRAGVPLRCPSRR